MKKRTIIDFAEETDYPDVLVNKKHADNTRHKTQLHKNGERLAYNWWGYLETEKIRRVK